MEAPSPRLVPAAASITQERFPEDLQATLYSRNQISLHYGHYVFGTKTENLCSLHQPNCTNLYICCKANKAFESFSILVAFAQYLLRNDNEPQTL